MGALLVIGSIGFWILMGLVFIFIIYSMENDKWGGTGATWTLIIAVGLMVWLGDLDWSSVKNFFNTYLTTIILCTILYIFIGVLWSFYKWWCRVRCMKIKGVAKDSYQVDASENKGRIIAWMCYWPFSALWELVNNPVKRFFNFLFSKLTGVYNRILNSVYGEEKQSEKETKKI